MKSKNGAYVVKRHHKLQSGLGNSFYSHANCMSNQHCCPPYYLYFIAFPPHQVHGRLSTWNSNWFGPTLCDVSVTPRSQAPFPDGNTWWCVYDSLTKPHKRPRFQTKTRAARTQPCSQFGQTPLQSMTQSRLKRATPKQQNNNREFTTNQEAIVHYHHHHHHDHHHQNAMSQTYTGCTGSARFAKPAFAVRALWI